MTDAVKEGSPWATKAEAGVQQLRRFSQHAPTVDATASPPLPPLTLLHEDALLSDFVPMAHVLNGSARATGARLHDAPAASPRPYPRPVPSVATLNRELASLTLQLAGVGAAAAETAPPSAPKATTPLAAITVGGRTDARLTSAPPLPRAMQQPARRHSDAPTSTPHFGTGSDLTRLTEAPPLPRGRQAPASPQSRQTAAPPSQMLPTLPDVQALTPLSPGRLDSSRGSPSTASATPPLSLETHTSLLQDSPPADADASHARDAVSGRSASPIRMPHSPAARKSTPVRSSSAAVKGDGPSSNGRGKDRDGRITVAVRKRPLAAGEAGTDCVHVDGAHIRIAVTKQRVDLTSYEERSDYVFDSAFSAEATNQDVYATAVRELLTVSLAGGSASCFAYGQTGSGKTYTMMGSDSEKGLYLQAAADLFDRLGPGQQLVVSFFEIYCNSLYDLLNRRHPIVLREGANRRVNVCGVLTSPVAGVEELWQLVQAGMQQRRTGTTTANEHSSRSHAVLTIRITDTARPDFAGSVNFVDLAGSERAADTAAHDRVTRLEGAEINKSLLALKECIRALDEKRKHVPFRGSRLTEVLRDSFTGNSKTVMIATVSPSTLNHEHTNNTLRYAFRVKGLSIASVEPSKARNAPRPYVSAARSRSSAVALAAAAAAPEAAFGTPHKQRRARKRRHRGRKARGAPTDEEGGTADDDEASSVSSSRAPPPERASRGPRLRVAQRARAHEARRGSAEALPSAARQGISSLLPNPGGPSPRRSARDSAADGGSPPSPASRSSSASTSSSVTRLIGAHASGVEAAEEPRPVVRRTRKHRATEAERVDVAALEQRLTQQIMEKLRQDLGRQLEDVLSEKDAAIAALRRDNERLQRELEAARREGQRWLSTPREEEGERAIGRLPALPYPPSPSILQEDLSCGGSGSSAAGEEHPLRMVP